MSRKANEFTSAAAVQAQDPAVRMSASRQNHRVASPAMVQSLAPLGAAEQTSSTASIRSRVVSAEENSTQTPSSTAQRIAGWIEKTQQASRAVTEDAGGPKPVVDDGSPKTLYARDSRHELIRLMANYAKDTLIDVDSAKALIPLTIVGSGTTVVRFNGEAGNIINAVVQLKDHRYDKFVKRTNCYGMYLQVELRNHYKLDSSIYSAMGTAAVAAATQAREYADLDTWRDTENSGTLNGIDESSSPDFSSEDERSSRWSNFWDSVAPLFDNSAMCKVLQSVSMRVDKVPVTESYYIILRSTTAQAFQRTEYHANSTEFHPTRREDSPYTCELNVFFDQEPAVRLKWRQLTFALVLPLLVLLLPLPFTMRRADLVQQYMMDSDFAEWMWMPPLLLRKKMVEALKAGVEWVVSLRSAYQQHIMRNHLLRQEQAHQGTGVAQSAAEQEQPSHQTGVQRFGWGTATRAAPSLESQDLTDFSAAAGGDVQAEPLPPRRQQLPESCTQHYFHEEEANISICSQSSTHSKFSLASIGSGFDEPHDSAYHHRCHHQTGGSSNADTVSPPHSACSRDPLMEDVSRPFSTTGCTRWHRQHARESSAACEAARAVSVHVPPSPDAAEYWREDNQSGPRARSNGHDVLFTAEELADAGRSLPTRKQHQHAASAPQMSVNDAIQTTSKRPREEEEAMASCEGAVDGAPISGTSVPIRAGIAASPAATAATCGPAPASSAAKSSPDEEEEESFCRICREGEDVAPLIVPCACTGSVRFVHPTCLDRWRIESAKRNLANVNHCEICKEPFRVNIQRSMLLWESSQHILNGICLFLACFVMLVAATTLTHVTLGELSCSASYHQVAYSTMFRFEGLSLTLFVYCLMVLLLLYANLIVYSWFRSQPDVEEYVEEMHIIPPFYTRHNVLLIVLVGVVLLTQAHAMGYLLKYLLYKTSHLAWNWETSPLIGGMLFSLFSTCTVTLCSWGRYMYLEHVVNRGRGDAPTTDVVVETIGDSDHAEIAADTNNDRAAPTLLSQPITVPATIASSASPTGTAASAAPPPPPPPSSPATPDAAASSPAPPTVPHTVEQQYSAGEDPDYTRHFTIPPDQRVIRAFEYCPPRRKLPK
ncbi:RING-variant domain containing protein, putative [Leishmania lindenbergi]|uniref:RING-variant domain containing protein n=1 Tax=Leishmania lindenbergi TaxID=651832 RepID=A0AAW3A3D6_9TRYP